jgi:uncharacterized protein
MFDGLTVFDCHQHHGQLAHAREGAAVADRDLIGDAEWLEVERSERVTLLDHLAIDRTLVMAGNQYQRADGVADSRRMHEALRAYCDALPTRFAAPIAICEPTFGQRGVDELRRAVGELGMVGVQWHARWQGAATDDPWILRGLEAAGELRILAFLHSHADSALEAVHLVEAAARSVPELPVVMLDAFGGYRHSLECFDAAERCPNLLFETSQAWNLHSVVEAVERFGAERVLFGSDIYSHPITFRTANTPAAMAERIGREELGLMLSGNLERLLAWQAGERETPWP